MDREQLERWLETYSLDEILDTNNMDIIDLLLIVNEYHGLELPNIKPL